jgi:Ca2+/Na+ antiporter
MLDPVIIIWVVLLVISAAVLMLLLKHRDRKLSKYDMLFRLGYAALAFGLAALAFLLFDKDSVWLVSISRLCLLFVGVINVVTIYKQAWTKRDRLNAEEDSFWIEMVYILSCAFTASVAFVAAPYAFQLIPYSEDLSAIFWDIPLVYALPYFIVKVFDITGHMPLKAAPKPWLFPIERVEPSEWNWKAKVQRINFELHDSLETEYDLFSWYAKPYIEAPLDAELGKIFRMCIQIRREKGNYTAIQDMGDEYDGAAQFCWLYYKKPRLLEPESWFKQKRYLNPFASISANGITAKDIIVAQRIHGDGSHYAIDQQDLSTTNDDEKTVFISR